MEREREREREREKLHVNNYFFKKEDRRYSTVHVIKRKNERERGGEKDKETSIYKYKDTLL